jgi:hypothetical protein
MKKIIVFILWAIMLITSAFAYTPTSQDLSIVNSIWEVFGDMAKTNPSEAKTYLSRLNSFSTQFRNSNPRYSYLFWALADIINENLNNETNSNVWTQENNTTPSKVSW